MKKLLFIFLAIVALTGCSSETAKLITLEDVTIEETKYQRSKVDGDWKFTVSKGENKYLLETDYDEIAGLLKKGNKVTIKIEGNKIREVVIK